MKKNICSHVATTGSLLGTRHITVAIGSTYYHFTTVVTIYLTWFEKQRGVGQGFISSNFTITGFLNLTSNLTYIAAGNTVVEPATSRIKLTRIAVRYSLFLCLIIFIAFK